MVSRSVVRTINTLAFTHYIARRNWRAVGRIWLWYWDGTNIVYQSRPAGGGSWTSPEAVRSCNAAREFATWFDGTYFHYAYSQGQLSTPDTTVFYRRGLANADGSIIWSAAEQTAQVHLSTYRRRNLTICVDDGGYPWIAWHRSRRTSSANYYPFVTTSSTNDGTWTTATGYPFQVINSTVTWYVSLVPMTSGKVMLFYGGNWRLYERILTAVSKGSQTTISGYQASNRQLRHNAVAIGDIVYLCYQWGTTAIRFQVYNGGWGAVETPVTPADRPGLLAKVDDSTLMLFWENAASVIKYKEYTISGGSWGSEETFQNETTDTILSWGVMQASYDGGGRPFLHYATKAAAPYDMIFAEWEPPHADLLGEFVVNQWQEDLPASFHVGQDSAELRGNVGIRHAGTPIELLGRAAIRHPGFVELLGRGIIRNVGSAELLGKADVGQDSAELLGNAVIRQPGSAELLGKFAAQVTAELLGNAEIRQSGPKPWIVGWNLRKSHTITGSVAGAQTNYPIGIKVYYGSGTDGTETIGGATFGKVYCDSKCRVDFGDIRFTKSDETSLLDYWIEEQVDSDYAIIWVEVDSIPASPGTTDIYIYYGNAGATTTSNGDDTFLIFNDCATTTGWSVQTITGSPIWGTAIEDGVNTIYIEANAHNEKLRIQYDAIISTGRENRRALTRVKHTSWNADGYFNWYTPLILSPSTQYDAVRYSSYFDKYTIYASVGGVSDTDDYNVGHPSGWYRYEKKTNAAGAVTAYRGDTDLGTATVDGDYSGGKVMYYVNEWNPGLTKHYIDWFAIGKYVDPEPTHATWGPETPVTAAGGALFAEFEVGQGSAELLGRFEAQVTAELLGIVDITHSADLLGRAEVGQNAENLKAAFDSQVTLNLHAKFVVRHSVPSSLVGGPNFVVAAGINSLEYPFLRKTWYANGRHWVFYVADNWFRYMSSTDGITWNGPVDIRATGNEDHGWQVGTYLDDNGYFYYAYWWVNGVPLVFRRGFLESDGTITWSTAVEQTATPVPAYGNYYPSICVDDGGYPWIAYTNSYSGGKVESMVTKSSTNDGTWVTAPNYPAQLVAPIAATITGSIVAMTGGQVFVVRVRTSQPNLQGWLCDASGPGALQEKAIGANVDWQAFNHTLVSIGDTAWTAVMTRTGGVLSGIYVVKYQSGSWGDSVKAESGGSAPPSIFTIDEDIYIAWKSGDSWRYRVSTDGGASWGASSQILLATPNGIRSAYVASFADRLTNPLGFSWITDAADIEYGWIDVVSAPELFCTFDVGQDVEDLKATFAIRHIGTPQNLHAVFELQISLDLLGEFVVRHTRARALRGKFDVGQDSIDLPARFEVGQGSADLFGKFEAQAVAELLSRFEAQVTAELLGRFEVGQGSAELPALFLIPRAYNFSSGMGISFDWWGSGGVDQQIDFEMWSLTGGWVGRFPDGPAEWRKVQLTWDDLTEVDLDGTRPDSSQIIGIYWTYHTPGVRRIDGIRAWMRQDLLCKVVIRNASASDLLSRFEAQAQATADLLGKFEVGQGFNDLKAVFHVEMTILGALWDYQYVWDGSAQLEIGVQQGQIEEDPTTRALTARLRFVMQDKSFVCMAGGNRVYSKGTFDFDAEVSVYSGANPKYYPAFGLVENKYDRFVGFDDHAALLWADGAGGWDFVTEDGGTIETTPITGIDFTAQNTFRIIWEDATEFPATGRVRLWINGALKATHIVAVPTHPLQFFLLMDATTVAAVDENAWVTLHSFNATGVA